MRSNPECPGRGRGLGGGPWSARARKRETGLTLGYHGQLPGSTDKAASFEFLNEGHTLGNALRYIVMKK
jgi:hypothetical protein